VIPLYTTRNGSNDAVNDAFNAVNDSSDGVRDAAKEAYVEFIQASTSGCRLEQDILPRLFT